MPLNEDGLFICESFGDKSAQVVPKYKSGRHRGDRAALLFYLPADLPTVFAGCNVILQRC